MVGPFQAPERCRTPSCETSFRLAGCGTQAQQPDRFPDSFFVQGFPGTHPGDGHAARSPPAIVWNPEVTVEGVGGNAQLVWGRKFFDPGTTADGIYGKTTGPVFPLRLGGLAAWRGNSSILRKRDSRKAAEAQRKRRGVDLGLYSYRCGGGVAHLRW